MDLDECKASILAKMWRRGLFGGKYQPVEELASDVPDERSDLLDEALTDLYQRGFIRYHKDRKCASINTSYKEEVREFLSGHVEDYILDLR